MEEIVEKAKNYSYSVKAVNVFNKLKKGTGTLEDSINVRVPKLVVKGKCEQETTTGANLLGGINSVSGATDNKNGSYSQTISELTTIHWFITDYSITIPSGKDFYLSFDAKASSNQTKGINTIYCNDGTSNINGTEVNNPTLTTNYQRYVFKISALDTEKTLTRISTQESPLDGVTVTYKNLMVSFNNVDYEPYTGGVAMPSPDFPSEIKTVKGVTNLMKFKDEFVRGYTTTKNGITFTVENDLSISVKGTATATTELYLYGSWGVKDNKYLPNGSITFSINDALPSGCISNLALFSEGTNIFTRDLNNSRQSYSIDLSTYTYDGMSLTLQVNNGKTVDFNAKLMINEGTIAYEYVPYGTWLKVKSRGKNLFDISNNPIVKGTHYDDNGNLVNWNNYIGVREYVPVQPNKTYIQSNSLGKLITDLVFYDKNKKFISKVSSINTFITPNNVYFIKFAIYSEDNTIPTWLQIEEDTDTPYEPYQESTALIDMNIYDEEGNITGNRELCEIGEVEDEVFLNKSTNKTTQRIGKVVLDGSEEWIKSSSVRPCFSIFTFKDKKSGTNNFISDKFTYKGNAQNLDLGYAMSFNTGEFYNYLYIQVPTDIVATGDVDAFKIWLSENNVTVYYQLATPVEIEQEVIELPYTYEDATHISSNDEVAEVEVDYYSKEIPNMNKLKVEIKEI